MIKKVSAIVIILIIIVTGFCLQSKPILLGDINNDSRINSMDMLLIKRHILDIDKLGYFEKQRADLNRDGTISNIDLVMIRKYILMSYEKGAD